MTGPMARVLSVVALASFGLAAPVRAATAPNITLSAASGPVGTPMTITGGGFPANEIVALYIDSPSPFIGTPGPRANAQGGFTQQITWPGNDYDTAGRIKPAAPGPHRVCADTTYPGVTPSVEAQACAEFLVVGGPSPSPSPVAISPAAKSSGTAFPLPIGVVIVVVVLIVLGAGGVIWWRRAARTG